MTDHETDNGGEPEPILRFKDRTPCWQETAWGILLFYLSIFYIEVKRRRSHESEKIIKQSEIIGWEVGAGRHEKSL